jgi:pimeloyl-ACP methyl ester carboxylesterase
LPELAIAELRIHYEMQGEGEALLLLPDDILAVSAYQDEIEHLAERFSVIAADYPGRGLSSREDPYPDEHAYDLWGYRADLACHLLQDLGVTDCHIVGSQGGALVALHVAGKQARLHGIRPLSVIADSLTPDMDSRALHRILDTREHYYRRQHRSLAQQHGDDWRAVVDADTAFLRQMASRGGYALAPAILNGVACPTLLLGCLADPRTPGIAAQYARLAELIPDCCMYLAATAGHPHIEYPLLKSDPILWRTQAALFWDRVAQRGQAGT